MKYKINGAVFQNLVVDLDENEFIYSEPGRLLWMSSNMNMNTSIHGGMVSMLKRKISGEKMLLTKFTPKKGSGKVALAGDLPGRITALNIKPESEIVCEQNAFIAGGDGIEISPYIIRSVGFGMLSRKKFIFQSLEGNGVAFISSAGEHSIVQLNEGEAIYADLPSIIAFSKSINISIRLIPGIKNALFAEAGLFLAKLEGPGKVYIQNTLFKAYEAKYGKQKRK